MKSLPLRSVHPWYLNLKLTSTDLSKQVAELQSKNAAVVRELEEFDRLSRELQQEKVAAQSESQRELRKERELLRRQKTQMQKRLTEAEAFKNERLKLVGENRHLVTVLARSEREVERLQAELDRAHEDSRYWSVCVLVVKCQLTLPGRLQLQ